MPYVPTLWEDFPSTDTAITAARLNNMEAGIANDAAIWPVRSGTGDVQKILPNYDVNEARQLDLRLGTTASPDTGLSPPIKVSRIFTQDSDNIYSDGAENLAGISSNVVGATGTETQSVGVYGAASNSSTSVGAGGAFPDACAIYGFGYITGSGVGTGMGGCFIGRKDATAGLITTLQLNSWNASGTNSTYSPSAPSDCAILMGPGGGKNSGAGILMAASDVNSKFDVGIAFMLNAGVNVINSASIRDDASATTSIDIRGSHTYGIDLSQASSLPKPIRLANTASIWSRNAAGSDDVALISLTASDFITFGTTIAFAEGGVATFGTSTGFKFGFNTTEKLGFWGATPVVRPSSTGETVGFTAGGGTTVTDASTFTGNVGTKAYRVSDIVKHLKNLGLIASS